MSVDDRCCALLLNEMSLKRSLNYVKSVDRIAGFEDFGPGKRSKKQATQALVLMVRGIKIGWKQPLAPRVEAPRGEKFGEGVSPSPLGVGSAEGTSPPLQKIFSFLTWK
jgi:hypothetical protein